MWERITGALGGQYIGTEHLLLALLSAADGAPSQVLSSVGVSLDSARAEVRKMQDG